MWSIEHGHWHITRVHGSTYIITEGLWTCIRILGHMTSLCIYENQQNLCLFVIPPINLCLVSGHEHQCALVPIFHELMYCKCLFAFLQRLQHVCLSELLIQKQGRCHYSKLQIFIYCFCRVQQEECVILWQSFPRLTF